MRLPDSLLSSPHTQGLSHIADALEANRVQAATQQFNEMVEQSTDLLLLGSEIAEIMNALYDELLVEGMAGFIPWLRQFPVDEATDPVLRELNEPWELATDWQNDLRDLANERLARQIRKLVRDRDVSGATQLAIRFLLRGKPRGSQKQHRVRQLATILGTMGHDRTRAMKVADNICKQRNTGGLDSDDGSLLIDEMGKAQASLSLSEMGEYERQWNQMHTQCVVKLIRRLPGPGAENARPSPEDENRFYDSLHALLAAYYIDCGQDLESEASRERLQDVVRILKEFCPTDEREIGPVEGVEDVAFLRLGPGDRLVSVRSLRRLGEKERVVDTVLQSIHHRQKGRRSENLLYLMGGLANERFFPFLAAALRDKDHAPMHASIVDSLGRIGTEDALDVLSERFTRLTEKKVLESAQQRKVADCILALGRIARSPRTGSHVRDTIVSRVLDRLPDDRVLQRTALQSLCSWNPGGLNDENKDKILKIAVDSLWSLDRASNLQSGNADQRTELGFREEIANIVIAMGEDVVPMLLEHAEKRSLQYSGAFRAMAEILAKIGDRRALPFLDRILKVTMRTDDEAIPDHLRERYYDAANDRMVPLTRDKIAHDIVFTINEIGGNRAEHILQQTAGMIKSKEYDKPGEETMELLAKILVEKDLSADEAPSEATPLGTMSHKDIKTRQSASAPEDEGPRPRKGDSINALIKDVRGGMVFKKKMPQRISAIQELAARGDIDGIPALVDALEDKNKLVQSAAETALARVLNPQKSSATMLRHRLYEVLESMRKAKPAKAQAIRKILDKLRPERDPLKNLLLGFVHVEPDEDMKRKIASIFRTAQERLARSGQTADFPEFSAGKINTSRLHNMPAQPQQDGEEESSEDETKAPKSHTDLIDAKRQYFQARRDWIAGGKQGPEPPRPPGI